MDVEDNIHKLRSETYDCRRRALAAFASRVRCNCSAELVWILIDRLIPCNMGARGSIVNGNVLDGSEHVQHE